MIYYGECLIKNIPQMKPITLNTPHNPTLYIMAKLMRSDVKSVSPAHRPQAG